MPSATSPAASPSRSSTVTAAPARESLTAQARPMPLAAPVTRALRPVRSTFTDDLSGSVKASLISLLRLERRRVLDVFLPYEPSIGQSRRRTTARRRYYPP